MEVKEYSPLWLRDSNACDTCTPKIVDIFYSNYFLKENYWLYIVYNGDRLRIKRDESTYTNGLYSFISQDGCLEVINELEEEFCVTLTVGCSYQYGYAQSFGDTFLFDSLVGSLLIVSVGGFGCKINDFLLTKYFIDCETEEWVYIFNGALNRLPSNLADEATGIMPNGQSKRYFARIEKKYELRVKQISETDLDILEYILNQPQISLTISDKIYNISEGSIFTFDFDNYGLFYGICEVVESTMIVQKCCEVSGS